MLQIQLLPVLKLRAWQLGIEATIHFSKIVDTTVWLYGCRISKQQVNHINITKPKSSSIVEIAVKDHLTDMQYQVPLLKKINAAFIFSIN